MSELIPYDWSAYNQKIGRTNFVVITRFCGHETIFQKLTRLIEDELNEPPEQEKVTVEE